MQSASYKISIFYAIYYIFIIHFPLKIGTFRNLSFLFQSRWKLFPKYKYYPHIGKPAHKILY